MLEPDVVLVPLLAFEPKATGWLWRRLLRPHTQRLRKLKPVVAVGIGYDELKIDAVPHLDYDQRLDWVLTLSGPLRCGEV